MAAREPGKPRRHVAESLREIYRLLVDAYGPQDWWPADTATEVVIGAILTQNTAWKNVERAITSLKAADRLTWPRLHALSEAALAKLIRPAGTFRVKARRLKAFIDVLFEHFNGSLAAMLKGPLEAVRTRLLAIHGIGPETADAILLYAGERASFVVDAYTMRILRRHFLLDDDAGYEIVQRFFHQSVTPNALVYNEYHALLVRLGKEHCRTSAICEGCPLIGLPHDAQR